MDDTTDMKNVCY